MGLWDVPVKSEPHPNVDGITLSQASDLSTWPVEYPMRTKLPQAVRVRAVASAVLR